MKTLSKSGFIATNPCEHSRSFDVGSVPSQWSHPLLAFREKGGEELSKEDLRDFAYDYYLRLLPFFRDQAEGSLVGGVTIEFTNRMRQKLGLAYFLEHRIRLNQNYFARDPSLLPYTLFHELTHLWLYDCLLDPGHTRRFYKKMTEFESTGLQIDPEVYIHTRLAPEAKYVYSCPNCNNRWYRRDRLTYLIYCGHCFDQEGVEYYAKKLKLPPRPELETNSSDSDTAA